MQFTRHAGGFSITLFSTPVPLRAGPADLSVMVETEPDKTAVLDAAIILDLTKPGERSIQLNATHSAAINKLLYATPVVFPSPGTWRINVRVQAKRAPVNVSGTIEVFPEQAPAAAYWPYFAAVPVLVLLFGVNQWLKRKRRVQRPQGPS